MSLTGIEALSKGEYEFAVCRYGDISDAACETLDDSYIAKFDIKEGGVFEVKNPDIPKAWKFDGATSIIGLGLVIRKTATPTILEAKGVLGIKGSSNSQRDAIPLATCIVRPLPGAPFSVTGQVDLMSSGGFTRVRAKIEGLVGHLSYGFHIHQFGDISSGASVGPHFDVEPKSNHGLPGGAASVHIGDLGNIQFYDNAGAAWYNESFSTFKLTGDTNSILGRAMIIHSRMDNGCEQPTGGAGDKLAACVIGASAASSIPQVPFIIPRQKGSVGCDLKNTTETSPKSASFIWMTVLVCLALAAVGALFAYNWWKARQGADNPTTVNGRQPWYVQQNEDEEDATA